MLDINSFFNEIAPADIRKYLEYHPSQAEYQPLREYLISQGVIAVLDSENCESDEIIINALKKEMSHWNWRSFIHWISRMWNILWLIVKGSISGW